MCAEIPNKEHWFWDTETSNDGGVLNDAVMRNFYEHCYETSFQSEEHLALSVNPLGESILPHPQCAAARTCEIVMMSPSSHTGGCGLRVLQQHRYMQRASVSVEYSYQCLPEKTHNINLDVRVATNDNIRKLFVDPLLIMQVFGNNGASMRLFVNGIHIALEDNDPMGSFYLCFHKSSRVAGKCEAISALIEKTPDTAGPVRAVYNSPFVIVYGTSAFTSLQQATRSAMYDLAVYIANAHVLAEESFVQVMSDTEYIQGGHNDGDPSMNAIFIGGPSSNAAMEAQSAFHEAVHCHLPVVFHNTHCTGNCTSSGFGIGTQWFAGSSDAVISTFSLLNSRMSSNSSGLGVLIHANAVSGYLHLSRLAWPVVPPMVRVPFALNLPDFLVVDTSLTALWGRGFGAVRLAGFWDSTWCFDADQAYNGTSY